MAELETFKGVNFPKPLTPYSTGDKKADEAISKLAALTLSAYDPRERPYGKEHTKLTKIAAKVGPKKLLPILDDAALEIGGLVNPRKPSGPKGKKAFETASEACVHARKTRLGFLDWLFEAVMPAGHARVLEIAASNDYDSGVRERAILALEAASNKKQLVEVAKRIDVRKWNGKDKSLDTLYMVAIRCWHAGDPKAAYDALAKSCAKANLVAETIVRSLIHADKDEVDKRWQATLAPLCTTKLDFTVYMALENLLPDPAVIEPLVDHIGEDLDDFYWHDDLVRVLARVATPALVPHLTAALKNSWMHYPAVFEGFANAGDPAAAHIIREWLVENSTKERKKEADAVIKKLEKKGKAPKPTTKVLAKDEPPPPTRPALEYVKAGKFKAPKLVPAPNQKKELEKMFAEAGIPEAASILKPCVVMIPARVDENTLELGATKLGGHPDLPAKTEWPRVKKEPLTFLAQLNLADFVEHLPKGSLPASGTLAFFVDNNANSGVGGYLENARVIFTKAGTKLERREVPEDFVDTIYQACKVELVAQISRPSPSNAHVTEALDEETVAKYESDVYSWTEGALPQVLGYRNHGYDAEEPATAELLLQLTGENQSEMQFGDMDFLNFFIDGKKLAKGDFSKVWPHVGD